ncbi:hypothetical protein TcasGA2_TC034718 [Tribolium castaneum]|uniref:Uncharacterized protein n=1 Tax=Tribolium castaneum TaxID=7070 RepID=A0A139WGN3_TRICA|nr:hypothetical protein TcasGA2_TC034718 [Tribolium castaneum]
MQHAAGLQYGQGAVNSHQSPTFADITQTGGNTTSSLRQFRKKEGPEKNTNTDLNDTSHIARVPPHNHYPARPNDYYRYPQQYPDYTTAPYKESPAQVKYSEIAETPLQNVDHLSKHKDLMDMCNLQQMPASRQQNYASNPALQYHPESQYQQYKYAQCRKYPPQENDFLAKLQRINPTMARSIMSDHHIRESQTTYPHHYQNQRYYPAHNPAYNYQYNYPSCNYRANQMPVGGAQYNDRSLSPRNLMMNYSNSQKISPNYQQYNPPEYAQHYQHRRVGTTLPQDYYQQCRSAPYNMPNHQETNENRSGSGGLRHFIENWAEEEAPSEITPIFKENVRLHGNDTNNEQVFVINSSDFPPCLENVSLVPTENGQYIIKTGALDNSIVRIKETENNGERTVNLQIVEKNEESGEKTTAETTVPYQENQTKDCDQTDQGEGDKAKTSEAKDEESIETSVIVANEASIIKDMPLIDEETPTEESNNLLEENHVTTTTKRTQRIFSVDDIIGTSPTQTRRNSLQFPPKGGDEDCVEKEDQDEEEDEEVELRDAISVEDNSVILEIGGALVQLNINQVNGTKILSVLALSESLVIDVNGNYQEGVEEEIEDLQCQNEVVIGEENEENEVTLEENLKKSDTKSLREEEDLKKTDEETKPIEEELKKRKQTDKEEILKKCDEEEIKISESVDETKKTEAESVERLKKCDEEELRKAESIDERKKIEVEKLKKRDEELKKAELIDEKKKTEVDKSKKRDEEELKKAESIDEKKKIEAEKLKKRDRKLCEVEQEVKKGETVDENEKIKLETVEKSKKREKKLKCEEEELLKKTEPMKDETCEKLKKREKKLTEENDEKLKKREDESHEKKKRDDEIKQKKKRDNHERKKREKKLSSEESEEKMKKVAGEEEVKKKRERSLSEEMKKPNVETNEDEEIVLKKHGKKAIIESDDSENEESGTKLNETKDKKIDDLIREEIFEECARLTEEISKKSEEVKEVEKPVTKAAKKLYVTDSSLKKPKLSKLEETVNKIKSLKEKTANKEEKKPSKKVTFNLDNEEMDRKKLSWEEYNNRKRKAPTNEPKNKIMENTVTSSDDINDETVKKLPDCALIRIVCEITKVNFSKCRFFM